MKKGQAATEFLMTYGWALLVVLIAISALAFFGVLSPDRFLPSKCTVDPGFACVDWKVEGNTTQLVLKNSIGEDLTGVNVSISGCTGVYNKGAWNNGEQFVALITGCTSNSGQKVNWDISYEYIKPSGLSHIGSGELITEAQ